LIALPRGPGGRRQIAGACDRRIDYKSYRASTGSIHATCSRAKKLDIILKKAKKTAQMG
jgi:hypothetical protein